MTRHLLALALLLGGCPGSTGTDDKDTDDTVVDTDDTTDETDDTTVDTDDTTVDTDDTTVDTDDTTVDTDDTTVDTDDTLVDTDPVIDTDDSDVHTDPVIDSGDSDPDDTDTGDSDVIVPDTGDTDPSDSADTDPSDSADTDRSDSADTDAGDSADTDPADSFDSDLGDTFGGTGWDSFGDSGWDSFIDTFGWDSSADSFGWDSSADSGWDSGVVASLWGPATCLIFDASTWTYHRTTNNPANVPTSTSTLTLTPDDLTDAGAAVMSTADFVPPYRVTFDFRTWDDDGGSSSIYNSADGVALMIRKDRTAYGTPPVGGSLGVMDNDTGHSVQFKTYDNRGISVEDYTGSQLFFRSDNSVYTNGDWRSVSVEVYTDRMVVRYRGDLVFDQAITWAPGFDAIGFSAATGGSDSEHQIRDVCISTPLLRASTPLAQP